MDASALDPELERLLDHSDWLRALARKLVGDAATADDLVQETWLAAMKSPPDPARPVRPWLAGVVRRLARMRARGEGRRARRQTVAAREDALPSTSELVENVDTQRRLASVVTELSEPYRTTVMLRYFEGMSSADIARRQGVPSGTVRWRLKRGLDELRERLDQEYSTRSAWCLAFLAMERTHLMIVGTTAATTVGTGTLAAWAAAAAAMAALGAGVYGLRGSDVFAIGSGDSLAALEPVGATEPVRASSIQPALTGARMATPSIARLRLIEEDGTTTEGRRAVLVLPEGQAFSGDADEDGRLSFPTTAETATLFVAREASFLHIEELTLGAEELEVRLPAGASVMGRVLDATGAPVQDLALMLDSDRLIWDGREFPDRVTRELGAPRLIRTTTGPDGDFRFRGLSADWSGELGLPPSVSLVGRSRREEQGAALHVEGPRTDLIVEVERLPVVTGLLVQSGTGPVPGADVRVWLDSGDKPLMGNSNGEGRFEIQLDALALGGLRIEAENSAEGGVGRLELAAADLPAFGESGVLDLGLIELVQGLRQEFSAYDVQGFPIRGAVAAQVGVQNPSSPTGADGLGVLELSEEGENVIVIDAPGYLSTRGDTGFGLAAVELEPASQLTIQVADDQGAPLPELMVEIHAENRLFAEGQPYVPSMLDQVTMSGRPGELQVGETLGRFFLSEDGDLSLSGVVSGVPLNVQVFDNLGQLVATSDVAPVQTGEELQLGLTVVEPLRTLSAVVSDSAGERLVGALVEIAADDSHSSQTQDDGVAHFDQLGTDRVAVKVSMRGFATLVDKDYVLPPPGQSANFILDPGHDVEVHVLDGLGQPVEGGSIHATGSDVRVIGLPLGGSEQVLEDLGGHEQMVDLYLGGLRYQQTISPADGRLIFTVPVQGQLAVEWRLPELEGEVDFRIVAQPLAPSTPAPSEAQLEVDGAEELAEPESESDEAAPEESDPEAQAADVAAAEFSGEEPAPEPVDERMRVVRQVSGAAGLIGTSELVLAPGAWVVVLERADQHPAPGNWEPVGEPVVIEVDLESTGRISLGPAGE